MQRLELKPNRDLLDANFEGYKLSLHSAPMFRSDLRSSPVAPTRTASEDQYSFLHAKLFAASSNLLVIDSSDPDLVFLLDGGRRPRICRVAFDPEGVSQTPELLEVWSLPESLASSPGDYNLSLAFAGKDLAVVCDGHGKLFILDTGDRRSDVRTWTIKFEEEICGKAPRPFVIASAAVRKTEGAVERTLSCLIQYVEEKSSIEGLDRIKNIPESAQFINVVEWMTFASGERCWGLDRVRRFAFLGSTDYLQLTPTGTAMICCTDKTFDLVFDSSGTITVDEETGVVEQSDPVKLPPFYWAQDVDDLNVWVPLPPASEGCCTKRDIAVTLRPRELTVSFRGHTVLSGEIDDVLESDSLTWTIQGDTLEISATKANNGRMWTCFCKDATKDGEMLGDPSHIEDAMKQRHLVEEQRKVATGDKVVAQEQDGMKQVYNVEELDDCDAFPNDSFAIFVVNDNGVSTHKVSLSGHQLLLSVQASPNTPRALCLRHDVDGLVWQPRFTSLGEETTFDHIETFSALGYVQASKEQRRFSVASPDLTFAAISEASRRIYLYRQPAAVPAEFDLRNRKSGRRVDKVAKQQVLTLDSNDQIIGLASTSSTLVVATTNALVCYSLK